MANRMSKQVGANKRDSALEVLDREGFAAEADGSFNETGLGEMSAWPPGCTAVVDAVSVALTCPEEPVLATVESSDVNELGFGDVLVLIPKPAEILVQLSAHQSTHDLCIPIRFLSISKRV